MLYSANDVYMRNCYVFQLYLAVLTLEFKEIIALTCWLQFFSNIQLFLLGLLAILMPGLSRSPGDHFWFCFHVTLL